MLAATLTLVLALLRAITIWVPAVEGVVYKPDVEMLPTVELPPTLPSTSHVTPVFVVPETVAVNCCFCFRVSGARRGEIVTVTAAREESVRLKIVSTKGSVRAAHRLAIWNLRLLVGRTLVAKVSVLIRSPVLVLSNLEFSGRLQQIRQHLRSQNEPPYVIQQEW